jgi:hypothetical protein
MTTLIWCGLFFLAASSVIAFIVRGGWPTSDATGVARQPLAPASDTDDIRKADASWTARPYDLAAAQHGRR